MSSPAKPTLFPGISATETRLLVLANVCLKNDKIDYDKLASNAGLKASSAHTLFRNAKRKLDKLYADDNANADGASATMSPEDTSSKRGKANTKAPRTLKSPKTPKSAKATKDDKAAIKSEGTDDQDVSVKLEFSPLSADFDFAANLAEDTTRKAAVAAAEPVTETAAAESLTEPATTADAIKLQTEKEQANVKADEDINAELELAVNLQLPESPLSADDDGAYKQEKAQENDQHKN
ncbi:hypothetical protein N7537_002870 [Penicillium hordei]|uniref:Uncharacterized protein n=1 Tax=Penicillium hordei TaxID=40994 RepID=A0AAD6EI96_9EURO|nr:uncharacterized protein N7537_002870 [Penicillium hordei]KAJ5617756.1 hypothetical protein N7537_002870 [Penicillium hordei]